MNYEIKYMHRCLYLAKLGGGYVAPNPMVGAVVVFNDKIIGEGYHQRFGEAHAEPNAILSVKDKDLLKDSTLYVNLEPCSFFGKTPPCADLIIKSRIPRVVIGTLDPNPKVSGKGVEMLKNAGIEVIVGVLKTECNILNKRFFTFQQQKRPYIVLKWAQTKDGFIDTLRKDFSEPPLRISNPYTTLLVHKIRSENQAILVGTNTALMDNPTLKVKNWSGKNPIRLVLDKDDKIPEHYNLKDGSTQTFIFTSKQKADKKHLEYLIVDFNDKVVETLIKKIYELDIHSVMVEGGAILLQSFLQSGQWDETHVEVSTQHIIKGVHAPVIPLLPYKRTTFDSHECLCYKNPKTSI